jgi:hypothetical protein
MDLQEVGGGCGDWMELAQFSDRWRALVNTVMNLRVPKMRGISWLAAEPLSFSRWTLLHGVSKWLQWNKCVVALVVLLQYSSASLEMAKNAETCGRGWIINVSVVHECVFCWFRYLMCSLVNNKSGDLIYYVTKKQRRNTTAISQFRWSLSFHITICVVGTAPAFMELESSSTA